MLVSSMCLKGHAALARAARIAGAAIAVLVMAEGSASAQEVTESALKAAYIYNFALFTQWPANLVPAAEPFVICVLGDNAVGEALEEVIKGRVLGGHSMAVAHAAPSGPKHPCHVLYVSGETSGQVAQLVAELRDGPVLTISDLDGFTEIGGIAQFFFENGRLRFSVQLASAKRARLQLSSRLLALARVK